LAAKNPKGKTYWRKNFKDKHANLAKNVEGKDSLEEELERQACEFGGEESKRQDLLEEELQRQAC
jgi:hypothetical protein